MGSWNEAYLEVKCKKENLNLIKEIFECLGIKPAEGILDAPGIEVPYESDGNVFDLYKSYLFSEAPLFSDLDELFHIINKCVGNTIFYYNSCVGNTISDAYDAWEVKLDPSAKRNNVRRVLTEEVYEIQVDEKYTRNRFCKKCGIKEEILEFASQGIKTLLSKIVDDDFYDNNNSLYDDNFEESDAPEFLINDGILEKYTEKKGITIVRIPDNVKVIDSNAFNDCSHITSVIIPNSVTEINGEDNEFEGGAFSGCKNLQSVVFLGGNISINPYIFYDCEQLDSIIIYDSSRIEYGVPMPYVLSEMATMKSIEHTIGNLQKPCTNRAKSGIIET